MVGWRGACPSASHVGASAPLGAGLRTANGVSLALSEATGSFTVFLYELELQGDQLIGERRAPDFPQNPPEAVQWSRLPVDYSDVAGMWILDSGASTRRPYDVYDTLTLGRHGSFLRSVHLRTSDGTYVCSVTGVEGDYDRSAAHVVPHPWGIDRVCGVLRVDSLQRISGTLVRKQYFANAQNPQQTDSIVEKYKRLR